MQNLFTLLFLEVNTSCVIRNGFANSLRVRSGRIRPDPARKLLANLYDIYHCCVYSEKLLMMDRGTVRNTQNFIPKINLTSQSI